MFKPEKKGNYVTTSNQPSRFIANLLPTNPIETINNLLNDPFDGILFVVNIVVVF
jgi:hypothetical protein